MPVRPAIRQCVIPSTGRCIRKRLLSSEAIADNVSTIEKIPTTSNTSSHDKRSNQTDLATRVLNLLQRTAGTRRYEIYSGVIQHLGDDERPPRKRVGILDLSQNTRKSNAIDFLIGGTKNDTAVREAIDMRWESVPASTSRIVIRDGAKVARFGPVLEVPSPVLRDLNAEVVEIRDEYHAAELLRTDVPIYIMHPTAPKSAPSIIDRSPNSLILLDSSVSHAATPGKEGRPASNIPQLHFSRNDPAPTISKLKEELSKVNVKSSAIAMRKAAILAMLDECIGTLESLKNDLVSINQDSHSFQKEIEGILEQLNAQYSTIDLDVELQENKEALRSYTDSFRWFKVWEVDDMEQRLEMAVTLGYGVELERKLEWYAGSMAAAQDRIKTATSEYMNKVGPKLGSAKFVNRIGQMKVAALQVPPSCFTSAIAQRRQQLATIATPHLQNRYVQRVYSALLAMPVAGGVPAVLWASEFWNASLAAPTALLGLLLSVRYISRAWEKGYRKWWGDYDRIQAGLSHDIQKVVKETLEKRLRAMPQAAIDESNSLIAQQSSVVEQLSNEAHTAMDEAKGL